MFEPDLLSQHLLSHSFDYFPSFFHPCHLFTGTVLCFNSLCVLLSGVDCTAQDHMFQDPTKTVINLTVCISDDNAVGIWHMSPLGRDMNKSQPSRSVDAYSA